MTKPEDIHTQYLENVQKVEQSEQDVIYQTYVSQSPEWHRKMTRQLLRKVDFHLLPCLILMYLLNFLDRKYVPSSFINRGKTDKVVIYPKHDWAPLSRT